MTIPIENIRNKLSEKGLKVTPQRISILEAIYNADNHPTAEDIIGIIHKYHPNIATGTVYKVLDTLVENQLIKRVKTDKDIMRYDGIIETHHHLYCSRSNLIADYVDKDLDGILTAYFNSKKITGFKFEEIVLQIRGTFEKH